MYVSLQDEDKISVYTMDAASGRLEHQRDETVIVGPAALAIDPERKFLYVGRRGMRETHAGAYNQVAGLMGMGVNRALTAGCWRCG